MEKNRNALLNFWVDKWEFANSPHNTGNCHICDFFHTTKLFLWGICCGTKVPISDGWTPLIEHGLPGEGLRRVRLIAVYLQGAGNAVQQRKLSLVLAEGGAPNKAFCFAGKAGPVILEEDAAILYIVDND